jgi:hypothetical protein
MRKSWFKLVSYGINYCLNNIYFLLLLKYIKHKLKFEKVWIVK